MKINTGMILFSLYKRFILSGTNVLTISSRHWIVPKDASTISSDRLSTRVWAFVLISDETPPLITNLL